MSNFPVYCGALALCESCGTMQVSNYLDPEPCCPECNGPVRFYNDPGLQAPGKRSADTDRSVFSWNLSEASFYLPQTDYLCPQCRRMNLHFDRVGNWD